PLDTEGVFRILFHRDPRWGNLGEPLAPTIIHVQDTVITIWSIRHPTCNRNNPIVRAELYQLKYIPRAKWSMHEGVKMLLLFFS
ncbi:hypothetical protein ES332_D09G048700v1, partial [Gossypium tomentosum]